MRVRWLALALAVAPFSAGKVAFGAENAAVAPAVSASVQAAPRGDTVEERRHFDDRILALGVGLSSTGPTGLIGPEARLTPFERVSLGVGAGFNPLGTSLGGYLRVRPGVWGGVGSKSLNAFFVQGGYTYMAYGSDNLGWCPDLVWDGESQTCGGAHYRDQYVHFAVLTVGLEHQLKSGWGFSYGLGITRSLKTLHWQCDCLNDDGKFAPDSKPIALQLGVSYSL